MTRFLGLEYDGGENEFAATEQNHIVISKQMIYRHKALRVNYTTYDMRRNQDYLIPGINANIMLIAREDENDKDRNVYWYG